ncbi:T-cell activation Rho GTPase-activating protein [Rhineura floridana]|uniref:T-cell activation Rho GTPase-activating protein n=1 Tax=Rhineura floridana TaxID=261503 RepID=UPI002AC867F0|nr:T-cell activation Rho GTPase-activating protein [Rhineura floridana]XP_061482344.1 T-cell activation Rho GTPase-activating protein [Rhineura floridana]XP_061482345.1 T-cell activation Rho GTPase-activating protein [Rhineura floridana]
MKVLSSCSPPKTLNVNNMDTLITCQSEVDIKKCHLIMPSDGEDGLHHLTDSNKKRKKVISWPFMLRRTTAGSETLGHLESDLKPSLFDQPLSIVCSEEDVLPKPIQDILTMLFLEGPLTEGIFRKAANEKARKELKEELNFGGKVVFENKSVHLLAVVLKDFLRNIPHKLLLSALFDEWMTALEKISHQERTKAMKEVTGKLPRPNLLLLKHLLCVLHHISKSSEINKMDSSNLAICIGPNMLTPVRDQSLPLEVQKELTDKVKTLVEFLIDNCFDIFGEEISSLFSISAEDSLDRPEMLSDRCQHDSAYDSADFDGECNSTDLQANDVAQVHGTVSKPRSTELYSQQLVAQMSFVSSPLNQKSISNLDRRFSEPDMLSSKSCQEGWMRSQKLTKSEESFIQQEELGLKCKGLRKEMAGEPYLAGLYRNKKPPNLTIKAGLPAELSNSSLPRTSSSSSLDSASSVSDGSVFTSSPLTSPSASKKNALTRLQSFSIKAAGGSDTSNSELKKHSVSFSVATRTEVLMKTQSCSIGGFQRDSFKKDSKKERRLSCRIVQAMCMNDYSLVPLGCHLRPRFMSADEVFRLVDQKNPGNPPSYEEATKNCLAARLPSYSSLAVQNMRPAELSPEFEPQHLKRNRKVANEMCKDLFKDRLPVTSDSKDKTPAVDMVIGIHSRANLPLTPQVFRLRTMSGSYQKNKQEYLMQRCSQPAFDHIQCAKESYV